MKGQLDELPFRILLAGSPPMGGYAQGAGPSKNRLREADQYGSATATTSANRLTEFELALYGRVVIEASDGKGYHADLSSFSRVFCYPKSREDWQAVSIDGWGLALVWTTRFEVHVDQIIALADRVDVALQSA